MASNQDLPNQNRRIGALPFVISGLSFIPILGVIFGIISIIWGIFIWKRGGDKLVAIGLSGILFTWILQRSFWGFINYVDSQVQNGAFDKNLQMAAQANLNEIVPIIEFYKKQHGYYPNSLDGYYPNSLDDLKNKNTPWTAVIILDPRHTNSKNPGAEFFYKKVDDAHYLLKSTSLSGDPFGAGSLSPQIVGSEKATGLLTTQ